MKKGQGIGTWLVTVRRGVAISVALVTLWLWGVGFQSEGVTKGIQELTESSNFVLAILEAELGTKEETGLAPWTQLIFDQSPLLLASQTMSWDRPEETATPSESELEAELEPLLPPTQQELELQLLQPPLDDLEDENDLVVGVTEDSQVVAQTILPTGKEGYVEIDGVYIYNASSLPVDESVVALGSTQLSIPAEGPQILIIHTHGTEAYTPTSSEDSYVSCGEARTTDSQFNIMRVGEEMAEIFQSQGFEVIHDTNLYDYPEYDGSYDRSMAAVQAYLEEYPTIQVVLDVHRDALVDSDGTIYKPVTTLDGVSTAQVMLVLGSNELYSHDSWQENLSLAVQVQQKLNSLWPTLTRPITLKSNRYNQQLSVGSLLVEVGSHGNSLEEALVAARYFARATGAVLQEYLD